MSIISSEKEKELKELSGGNEDLIKLLLDKYITNTKNFLEQIEEAIKNNDHEKIKFAVHTLKGSSLSLGLIKLGEKFTNLNLRAKEGDFKNFDSEVSNAVNMLDEVIQYRQNMG